MPNQSAVDQSRLTIVIPAFNEEAGIGSTLQGLRDEIRLADANILVIDDGSIDQTGKIAIAHGAMVIRNRLNLGYGASLKKGIRSVRTPLVAWFDADGQHDPADLADMVERLQREMADAVLGTRTRASHVVMARLPGKMLIEWAANWAAGQRIPDVNCGLRIFRRSVLQRYLHLLPDGFSASTTTTLLLLKRNYQVVFHPIRTAERLGKSSVKQVRDGLRTLHIILRIMILFNALRFFSVWAAGLVLVGMVYGTSIALLHGLGFPVLAALMVILGVQIFFLGVVCDQISAIRMERLEGLAAEEPAPSPEDELAERMP